MKLYLTFNLTGYFMMVLPVVLGFTLAYPNAIQQVPKSCPTRCKCNMTNVNCSGLGLREIPEGLRPDTTVLDLSYNRISRLNVPRLKELSGLRELNLRENDVTVLSGDIWSNLPRLKILDLSFNRIACSCPLDWLEKQFHHLRWNVHFINQNVTDCRRYLTGSKAQSVSLKSCMIKQRWKRTPSCGDYYCRNGGTCRPARQPICQCVLPFYGRRCEFRTDDKALIESDIVITVDRVTATSIAISWNGPTDRSVAYYRVKVSLDTPSTQSFHREPITVQLPTYVVDGLQPSTSYRICVSVFESKEQVQVGCIVQTTKDLETTVVSLTGTEKDVTFGSLGEQVPPGNPFPRGDGSPKQKGGDEMQYAFISLAALFGMCMLLTITIGFVYYRRVHRNITEAPLPENQQDASVTDSADIPPVEGIVLVSSGNEMTHRGILNPAYEPHANSEPYDANSESHGANNQSHGAVAENYHDSKRLVRFTFPSHSQIVNHARIPEETVVDANDQNVLNT